MRRWLTGHPRHTPWDRNDRRQALVYRGPAALPGCPEAVADLLRRSPCRFDVRYVGPGTDLPLTPRILAGATLYAQPGGASLSRAYRHLRRHRGDIRRFVRSGGRYLGFCLGGYLAGSSPGFELLPGDTDRYLSAPGATVDSEADTEVEVCWRGQRRVLFFQDGPYFWVRSGAASTVLATYPNDTIAAMTTRFGSGRVGVVGPHPEATESWYTDAELPVPDALNTDLGLDLVAEVMRP